MNTEPVLVTRPAEGVVALSINDDPLNRVTLATVERLEEVFEDVATDDAVLVERLGGRVALVPGLPQNLKVTTREDLTMARRWMARICSWA